MQKVVVTLKERTGKKEKFKSGSYRKVWCVGELIRPEFGVLRAEGDYIRIRVSLCLLCSENEMENGALHWRACVFVCVCLNVGGGNTIVLAHLHTAMHVCTGEHLSLFLKLCVHACFEGAFRVAP